VASFTRYNRCDKYLWVALEDQLRNKSLRVQFHQQNSDVTRTTYRLIETCNVSLLGVTGVCRRKETTSSTFFPGCEKRPVLP